MTLERLSVEGFRCIGRAELDADPACNLITGKNASGKTSLLEAIFFLGRGRSFRSVKNEGLIARGWERCRITGRLRQGSRAVTLGLEQSKSGITGRAGGRDVKSLAELATLLPVQAIDPEVHRTVDGAPQERRRYLDWGVFHVEPAFVEPWRRYQRALRQRNAALRAGHREQAVRAWDDDLVTAGRWVAERRRAYVAALAPHVENLSARLLGESVEIRLQSGWREGLSLEEALEGSWSRDKERAQTLVGPHRADLGIRIGGHPVRGRISRGQQKLLAAALLLAQLRCDAEQGADVAVLLVDDPAAELDATNLERLLQVVRELPAQLFITALDGTQGALDSLRSGRRFHVEHGELTALL
jgi:DNA replication and repair protein RecF